MDQSVNITLSMNNTLLNYQKAVDHFEDMLGKINDRSN
tara:strand:- start:33 stop:146 length:114 start_codon:yes stop_codon:yes gene_type:complete